MKDEEGASAGCAALRRLDRVATRRVFCLKPLGGFLFYFLNIYVISYGLDM